VPLGKKEDSTMTDRSWDLKHTRIVPLIRLILLIIPQSITAQAGAPVVQLSDAVRAPNGQIARMTHPEAQAYCRSQGLRLPSIRELALALNPDGVVLKQPAGVSLQAVQDAHGRFDFYYDPDAYRRGQGDWVYEWYWSATRYYHGIDYAYIFDAARG
jgi:hypothetical protein